MKTGTNEQSSFFYPALASVAMITPIFLIVIAGGILPEGLERGDAIVFSHGLLLASLAIALVLRAAYSLGFSKAFKKIVISKPNHWLSA
jgi:hypothetical protein